MARPKHAHFVRVAKSLAACQLVELELKLYIAQALQLVAERVGDRLPFKMSGSDFQDASLERLIDTFKKLSNCPQLVTRLGKFKDERNFVAHKAIASSLDPDGDVQPDVADVLAPRLKAIEREASALTSAISHESLKFIGHLYFDALEKG